jgi:hypothetical protein
MLAEHVKNSIVTQQAQLVTTRRVTLLLRASVVLQGGVLREQDACAPAAHHDAEACGPVGEHQPVSCSPMRNVLSARDHKLTLQDAAPPHTLAAKRISQSDASPLQRSRKVAGGVAHSPSAQLAAEAQAPSPQHCTSPRGHAHAKQRSRAALQLGAAMHSPLLDALKRAAPALSAADAGSARKQATQWASDASAALGAGAAAAARAAAARDNAPEHRPDRHRVAAHPAAAHVTPQTSPQHGGAERERHSASKDGNSSLHDSPKATPHIAFQRSPWLHPRQAGSAATPDGQASSASGGRASFEPGAWAPGLSADGELFTQAPVNVEVTGRGPVPTPLKQLVTRNLFG